MSKIVLPESKISVEKGLKTLSNIILGLGIILSAAVAAMFSYHDVYDGYTWHSEFTFTGIAIGFGTLISILVTCKILDVLAEISTTLKRIDCNNDPDHYTEKRKIYDSGSKPQDLSSPEVPVSEIKARKPLNKAFFTRSSEETLNGFDIGERVIIRTENTTGVIKYFTEEGPVVVQTNHSTDAFYFDDIKKMD